MLLTEQELRQTLSQHLQQCTAKECRKMFPSKCAYTVHSIRQNKKFGNSWPSLATLIETIQEGGGKVLFDVTLPPLTPTPYMGIQKEVERLKVGGVLFKSEGQNWYFKEVGKKRPYKVPQSKVDKLLALPQVAPPDRSLMSYIWVE